MIGTWTGVVPAGVAAGGPLIGRRAGQELARRELAELSIAERILHWIGRALGASAGVVPVGWFGLIVLMVLAVVIAIIVLYRVRPARARRVASRSRSVLTGVALSAQDYRQSAQRHAVTGDFAAAIVDGVRAIAAELEEREILLPRPGRTADELAVEAGRELPPLAADLCTVTRLFDDIRYGDKDGTRAGYLLVTTVDAGVRTARPAAGLSAAQPALADSGVPR